MKAYTVNGHKVVEGIQLQGREPFLFLGGLPPSLGWPNDAYVKVPVRQEDVTAVAQTVPATLGDDELTVRTPFLFNADILVSGEKREAEMANFVFVRTREESDAVLAHILINRTTRENSIVSNDKVEVYGCFRNEGLVSIGHATSMHTTEARLLVKMRPGGKISAKVVRVRDNDEQDHVLKISFDGRKINARRFREKESVQV